MKQMKKLSEEIREVINSIDEEDPAAEDEEDEMEEMLYSELEYTLDLSMLLADFAKRIAVHCEDILCELAGQEGEEN